MANIIIPQEGATLVVPNGDEYSATVSSDGKLTIKLIEKPLVPTVTSIKVVTTTTTAVVSWTLANATNATAGRDGKDSTGYGPWTSDLLTVTTQSFSQLIPNTEYTFTVTPVGGAPLSLKAKTLSNVVTPPVVVPDPTPTPTPGNSNGFRAFTLGGAVSNAADGGFNKFYGKRSGLYSTWAANGKIWAIDSPAAEYGTSKIGALGDFDVHVCTMMNLRSNWAGAAGGDLDITWETWLKEYKDRWGSRKGTLYIGPFHEFNGDWYGWSTRNATDQANMVKTLERFRVIWDRVFAGDARFKFTWVTNRDSKYGLDVRKAYPKAGVIDAIAPDYYDFGQPNTAAKWATELTSTQNGGSPVGLQSWIDFAKAKGVPLVFQEWGHQYGDNPIFVKGFCDVTYANRYTGTGSPAGKVLGIAYHNLRNKTNGIETGSGGDFFIQEGGNVYSKRPNASRALQDFAKSKSDIRQP